MVSVCARSSNLLVGHFRAMREQLNRVSAILPGSQGRDLALAVLCVPQFLDSGSPLSARVRRCSYMFPRDNARAVSESRRTPHNNRKRGNNSKRLTHCTSSPFERTASPPKIGDLAHKTGHLAHTTRDLAHESEKLPQKTGDLARETGDLANETGNLADKTGGPRSYWCEGFVPSQIQGVT
jgi:hypothetical protein